MPQPIRKKNTAIGEKLKGALTNLSVDVFGYETIISKNIIKHTSFIASKLNKNKSALTIRIFQKKNVLKALLYEWITPISIVSMPELSRFFTQETINSMKMEQSIKNYLNDFSDRFELDQERIYIEISTNEKVVTIQAFYDGEFLQRIALNTLIKYFK